MSCCSGKCGCGSACSCGSGCTGCGGKYPDLGILETNTSVSLITGIAPAKAYVDSEMSYGAENDGCGSGCSCGSNCSCGSGCKCGK